MSSPSSDRALRLPTLLPQAPKYSWSHVVLANLSTSYPHLKDRFPCITHPFATRYSKKLNNAFDLHALSTPPAFVLSQDQTLRREFVNQSASRLIRLFGRLTLAQISKLYERTKTGRSIFENRCACVFYEIIKKPICLNYFGRLQIIMDLHQKQYILCELKEPVNPLITLIFRGIRKRLFLSQL